MGIESLLAGITATLGRPAAEPWPAIVAATPRSTFLPALVWVRDGDGGHRPLDRTSEPEAWEAAAYSDQPLITEFTVLGGARVPLSSASAPSTVVRLLEDARLTANSRVLEIGTGTGFNTALLCARCSDGQVVSLDNVPELSVLARHSLRAAGHRPKVVTADGTEGWPDLAPYSHILATCSVRSVPVSWLTQTEPGGRIVTPWDSPWVCYGTLALEKQADGGAIGRFAAHGSYMLISTQRVATDLDDVLKPGQTPDTCTTALSPWDVAGDDLDAQFHLGLSIRDVWHTWDTSGEHAPVRLWLADITGDSWASVDWDGMQAKTFATGQYGPRRLWDEIAAAHSWWSAAGRPGVERYGMTVTSDGRHTPWLDAPTATVPIAGTQ
ncbi:methyltransferase domain-containing protein [Streptomyces sp. NBC_01408]|uniref:methyltransferase domain-containing protein n=1 Tax=Streptomyces sp. NBC_01408 TaxID=2903855 RepID=UPI002259D684|nr:methyltransferase domain-containing protein [Streptomyces sp. NBC_01408]MCX4692628.1 methyltransferase [Streptomyces sp. NBC_01408]